MKILSWMMITVFVSLKSTANLFEFAEMLKPKLVGQGRRLNSGGGDTGVL